MVGLVSPAATRGSEPLCHTLPAHSGPNRETAPLELGAGLAGGGASGVGAGLRGPARAPRRQLFPEWGF